MNNSANMKKRFLSWIWGWLQQGKTRKDTTSILGIIIFIIGSIVTLGCRIQLGEFGGGRLVIEEEHKLITTGFYKNIRHPMYLGGFIGGFGLFLVFRGLIMSILTMILMILIFKPRMDYEEKILQEEFGEEYKSYMKKTKRLIPYIY